MSQGRPVSFGFLLVPLQLVDLAGPMDILENISYPYVKKFGHFLFSEEKLKELLPRAWDVTVHHIGPTMDPVELTGRFAVQPTCTVDNCPPLDYLLIGGPDPVAYSMHLPREFSSFINTRVNEVTAMFATCTGATVLAAAGVLDGKNATTNHTFPALCKENFPKVKWDFNKNWVIDGKFWTAGGAVAGMDMIAEWVRRELNQDFLDHATMLLDWQPRDVDGVGLTYVNGRGEKIVVPEI